MVFANNKMHKIKVLKLHKRNSCTDSKEKLIMNAYHVGRRQQLITTQKQPNSSPGSSEWVFMFCKTSCCEFQAVTLMYTAERMSAKVLRRRCLRR